MGNKPWIAEEGGRKLEAFLGARGMKTSEIATTEELIQTAAGVFEIPMQTNCLKMADAVENLSKSERRRLAKKNIGGAPIRHSAPRKAVVDALAAELGVSAADLRTALRALAERYKAIHDSQTKTLSQRAAEAARSWRPGRAS